jgi:hypothetical protein
VRELSRFLCIAKKPAEQALCGTFPTVTLAGGYSVCCIEHRIGCVVALPLMRVARRLEDRIRDLCAQAVAAGSGELNPILSDLKAALHEHTQRLRTMAAISTVCPPREFPPERRRDAARAESQ